MTLLTVLHERAPRWHTRWQRDDIVIARNDVDVDRIHAPDIQRVVMVCPLGGISPGDLDFVLFELPDAHVLLTADSGVAGRVHFERAAFWADPCRVYWLPRTEAPLPPHLSRGLLRWRARPGWLRVPRGELDASVDTWAVGEPQSWDARKWDLIRQSHPLASVRRVGPGLPLAR